MTITTYFRALTRGDLAAVEECFAVRESSGWFSLPDEPIVILKYRIRNKIVYGQEEVAEWDRIGLRPQAKPGDVELQVEQLSGTEKSMFTYVLRGTPSGWKIHSWFMWGGPE